MEETNSQSPISVRSLKKYIPIVTTVCGLTCIILFIGINLDSNVDINDLYKKWGAPSVIDLFKGNYWGLISSNFLHLEIWHIAFNLYWLWFFGKKIEIESKKLFYILLILSSAYVSSISQLSFSSSTGIGLSGIGYALFGYIFIMSRINENYKNYIDRNTTALFLAWLIGCIILTQFDIWAIGNAAHIGGLFWGILIAIISRYKSSIQISLGILTLLLLSSSLFWNPISTSWLSYKAYSLHENQEYEKALDVYQKILLRDSEDEFAIENIELAEKSILYDEAYNLHEIGLYEQAISKYEEILELDPENEFATENLNQIRIYQLSKKAYELHNKGEYEEAHRVYLEILTIDSTYKWATDNMNMLSY